MPVKNIFFILLHHLQNDSPPNTMKALVISGGGSKGAYAGGVAQYLLSVCNKQYDMFLGTSAGSLLVPLLAINKTEKLHRAFTNTTQEDNFNVNPFLITKKNDIYKTRINHYAIAKMFMRKKITFGESLNLRKLIGRFLTKEDFNEIREGKPEVVITVSNFTRMTVEYKFARDCNYEDFCDWVWASCNVVPFMSLLEKEGDEFADGGLGNIVPVYKAINMGATEIDAIILKTETPHYENPPVRNALELTKRAFDFMLNQIEKDDILLGQMVGIQNNVKLKIYRPQDNLTTNSLIFDPVKMKQWWDEGYVYAKNADDINKPLSLLRDKILESRSSS